MDRRLRKHPLGYWEIENKPTTDELHKYYADKYYQEGKGSYDLDYSEEELLYFNAKLQQRFSVIQRHLQPLQVKADFLDVGCGEGYALAFFRKQGWSVRGMDFSSAGVASKNADCLDALAIGDVFELLRYDIAAGNTYDVVWLQNVLEHVLDPPALLKSLRSLVAPGGVAVVTVPNDCSMTQRAALAAQHIDSAFWVAPPDHLSYFDSQTLANTVSQTGWQCVEMLGDFPVDWYLFHPGSNYIRDQSAGKAAHKARVQIENLISQQPIENVIQFWSSAAKLGLGRDLTVFMKPSGIE